MNNTECKSFDNLAQRSLNYFLATYPPFIPVRSDAATAEEQETVYLFLKSIYEKAYNDPSLLKLKAIPDDSYSDWEFHKAKPELITEIRDSIKKVEQLIFLLFQICLSKQLDENSFFVPETDMEIKPSALKQLRNFDIQYQASGDGYTFTFPVKTAGLKLLAETSMQNRGNGIDIPKPHMLFSRGVFDPNHPWTYEVFRNLSKEWNAFDRLISFLDRNDYERIDCSEGFSLNYVKNYGKKREKLKAAWAERTHGGIELVYEEARRNPVLLSLRIPYFKEILEHSDKMDDKLKSFITGTTKKCDGCRYCVQTDKSGTRPLAAINVDDHDLCPLFCGFSYRWRTIDDDLVDNIIELLQFIDEAFRERCA